VSGSAYNDVLKGNAAANTLSGNGGHDLLDGGGGNDVLRGGAGDDTLVGGAGADMLVGGAGWDTATYQDAQAGVVASLAVGGAGGDAAGDTFSGVEALIGSSHDDRLTGDDAANVLSGAGGNDVLSGGKGNDSLDGGLGDDTLIGGDGADALNGGFGFDMASYQGAGAGVVASLASGGTGGDAVGDTFSSLEGLIGSAYGDRLSGNEGHNLLIGHGGDDVLSGGGGNDTLDGGDGFDIADYSTAATGLSLDLSGGNSGDVLSSIEGLVGSAFDDVLSGNGAANLLDGGAGNDVLRGGDGSDTLWGDRGNDVFVFDTLLNGSGNVDAVMDFDFREDRIQLDSGVFAVLRSGSLDAAAFTLDKNATSTDHRIIYHAETGELFYDADGSGRIEQVKFAVLTPGTVLSADHFLVA
jgi:Ca2+-binding RTX toxin-like protein